MEPAELIKQLEQFDNKHGYRLEYEEVESRLEPIVKEIASKGEGCINQLHELITFEETWSCSFALKALKEIKSESSIPQLIEFLKRNEEGDHWESCEDAMFALHAIGKPAVKPLLSELTSLFAHKAYLIYLVGALTEIKDDEVYRFMADTCEDFLQHPAKYHDWFDIKSFCYAFDKQENKDAVGLLQRILSSGRLSKDEKIEIKDTIKAVEDPEGYKKEMEINVEKLRKELEESEDDELESEESESEEFPAKLRKLGRNELCHCGSGKKYKKCCLDKDIQETGNPKKVEVAGDGGEET